MGYPVPTDLRTVKSDPRYFVPAELGRRDSVNSGIRWPRDMDAEIYRLVLDGQDTGLFPWRSRSQVIRYLIVRGMQTLEPQPTHTRDFLAGLEGGRLAAYAQICHSEVRAFVADLRKQVMLIEPDDKESAFDKAASLITGAYATAQDLQDSPWKEELVTAIEQEWRQFLT